MSLSQADINTIRLHFPVGLEVLPSRDAIETAIRYRLVLNMRYGGNNTNYSTFRNCRFYTYGNGNGVNWRADRNYIRFFHLTGYSVSQMGVVSYTTSNLAGWRTALETNIVNLFWLGKYFTPRTTPPGYNPNGDLYMGTIYEQVVV